MKKLIKLSLALSCAIGATLALPNPSYACGGFFCSLATPIDQAGENILFIKDGKDMIAHVQIQFQGDAKDFSWVVPVPTVPQLSVGNDQVFTQLRNFTRPQFNLNVRTEGICKEPFNIFPGALSGTAFSDSVAAPEASSEPSVEVIAEREVGPFDTAIIQSDDPTALKTWLKDNGYDLPDNLDPLLDPYVAEKFFFLALKLKKESQTGDLQPIVMRYESEKPMIPIKLTGVAATEDMGIFVWFLGDHRAIPLNYKHAEINEALINWQSRGSNYQQVVTQAMNELGGKGFVTDYAGKFDKASIQLPDSEQFNLSTVFNATDRNALENVIRNQRLLINEDKITAFLNRHATEQGVNGEAAVQELQETVVKPLQDLQKAFDKSPYLTQLYTTLSPKEMTVDPSFDFNSQLKEVPTLREAEGIIQCNRTVTRSEAPMKIVLSNGFSYITAQSFGGGSNVPQGIPANFKVQELSPNNVKELEDNTDKIGRIMANQSLSFNSSNPSSQPFDQTSEGWGCACHSPNEPPPLSKGAGEGAAYMLALAGFLGWRKIKK